MPPETFKIELEHGAMVEELAKCPKEILSSLSPQKADLIHASMGIASEAGELLDAVKKHVMYNKKLDVENVIEELGDLEFYMRQIRFCLMIDRATILDENIKKLRKRYPQGYTDQAAQTRADKQELA